METKTCVKCGQEKSLSEYNKYKAGKDGLKPDCRNCHSIENHQWYESHKERTKKRVAQWKKTHPEKRAQFIRINRSRYPEQMIAQNLANHYPHKLIVVGSCLCKVKNKYKHHFDYSKPFNVIKLCPACHAAEHKRLRNNPGDFLPQTFISKSVAGGFGCLTERLT